MTDNRPPAPVISSPQLDGQESFALSTWIFLRALAILTFTAFLSALVQLKGLIGARGISPAQDYLHYIFQRLGIEAYWKLPTFFWIANSDFMLSSVAGAGMLCALLIFSHRLQRIGLIGAFLCYLSIVNVGGPFFSFQWDALLLETLFLACFLKPFFSRFESPSLVIHILFRLLLFKLMFLCGYVKLASGDSTWRTLSALHYHFLTQPLPTPLAYFAAKLPDAALQVMTFITLAIELVTPWGLFCSRRIRHWACFFTATLQLAILLTGNYCFFNLLTLALIGLQCDDAWWDTLLRRSISITTQRRSLYEKSEIFQGAAAFVLIGLVSMLGRFSVFNTYGVFAVMTTERLEISIEGSNDGNTWMEYVFRYKPGNTFEAPTIVAPHQPRLDWQMWFAALGPVRQSPWFFGLLRAIGSGTPEVLKLFRSNPFPHSPPKYLRANLYEYHFSTWKELQNGVWWTKIYRGPFTPIVDFSQSS